MPCSSAIQVVAVFPRLFGLIHGLIGVAHQGGGIFAVVREQGGAEAR